VSLQRPAGEPLSPDDPPIRWSYYSRDLMDARTEWLPVFARAMTWFEDDDAETETTTEIPLQRGN
jgi:hypothetical protein